MVSTSLTLIAMQAQSSSVPARFVNQPASDVIIINNSPEFRERLSLDVQGPQIDVGNYSPGEKIVAKTAPGVGVAAIMEPETESGASS